MISAHKSFLEAYGKESKCRAIDGLPFMQQYPHKCMTQQRWNIRMFPRSNYIGDIDLNIILLEVKMQDSGSKVIKKNTI